ncbi:glycoside hydrolase family 115 protein [Baudoinia panamericana UAMH 10762]|uniref:Glycoside hydrolase family 115 protein n=1 Tax=Baudoinia panamericana (strain UAMH 10762) TaxID=717646 RepID=M2N675_BAUPA|nr:glycoside hydrolase family 115 protein [Baudoinia panamericana UAMH 10762]EMC99548.1 glycoside hydrolase family 115 protein [Baudoinia panamericana UAMH 10762]
MPSTGSKGGVIIAGTIGNSTIIDMMISQGKFDISPILGTWEAYLTAVISDPMPGVSEAVVIAGSNRRGTVYGLYSISEQIGVSPWYYWADSPPQQHSTIYATDISVIQGSPSVKYRGFFLNDEAPALTGYIDAKFPPSPWGPGFNADFYKTVFELLLRLRANYLWPAQWNSMFNVDDPRSQALADEYGIVMGSSHTEPMMRATKEWNVFGNGPWQWNLNNNSIYPFFVEGAQRTKPYEGVLTMGMRGSGDTALGAGIETDLLENIIQNQTAILEAIWGNASVQDPNIVPQMWCLYKEVQGYYQAGMQVPDYIQLLWTDDNFGNIRRLPLSNETSRIGGAGVYYHFDYVGDPRDYKWINTVQLQKTWEQMHLAYERDARQIWVVNVGDLKPLELPISHYFDLAYDISLWDQNSVPAWLEMWAAREFGPAVASQTAALMNNYSVAAGRRKFELVDPTTYSLIDYNEADNVLAQWQAMQVSAQSIMNSLPNATQPAFFEMVYHPVTAGYVYYDIMISTARNNLYAEQGRNSANAVAQHVLQQFAQDHALTVQYNTLLNGKWAHMMDQTHIGYTYWQQPMRQALPGLQYVATSERDLAGDMGVTIQNSNATVPGDDMYHTLSSNSLSFTPFDPYGVSSQWIDIFSMGTKAFTWNITANASFVTFSQSSGSLSPNGTTDIRIWATVNWSQCPPGRGMVVINVTTTESQPTMYDQQTLYGTQYAMPQLMLPYNNTVIPSSFQNGFVESDAHITIEMEHWSNITTPSASGPAVNYTVIPGLSRTLSGVTLFPVTAPSLSTTTGPALTYNLYTFSQNTTFGTGNLTVTIATTTSLNTIPDRPLRYAVQLDNQTVKTVQYIIDQPAGANPTNWGTAVANSAWVSSTNFTYTGPGAHTLKVWALEPAMVLNTAWIDLGGIRPSYLGPPESYRVA